MAKIKQKGLNDISIDSVTMQDQTFITIHQDGKTIFLEHAKIVEFLKTVNTFKQ